MQLSGLDLAILLAYLLGVVVVGTWAGGRQVSASDYAVGSRDLPWWAVLASIVATETSTVTFLSIPGVSYAGDLRWLQLPMGYILGRLVVVAVLLPHYFTGQLLTAYEVLERRFGGRLRRLASAVFLVTRSLADGLRLLLTALVLQEVAGLDLLESVIVLGAATTTYTVLGGMRAVVWTDAIQLLVYLSGAVVALWVLCAEQPHGLAGVLEQANDAGKLRVFDLGFDLSEPFCLWSGLLGGAFLSLGTHGADQLMVQRYLCARSQRAAGLALGLSGVAVLAQIGLFLLIGLALWAHGQAHPTGAPVPRPDDVFAGWIARELPSGLRGVLVGAVLAAAMSTISSSLNSSATIAVCDLLVGRRRPAVGAAAGSADRVADDCADRAADRARTAAGSDERAAAGSADRAVDRAVDRPGTAAGTDDLTAAGSADRAADRAAVRRLRAWTATFGALQVGVALLGRDVDDSIVNQVLAIAGFATGLVLGVFLLGALTRRVDERAALVALAFGLVVTTAAALGTELAWPWFPVLGSLATFAAGLAAAAWHRRPRAAVGARGE